MEELLEAIKSATNVLMLTYQPDIDSWLIVYKNGDLKPDLVSSENLIEHLYNA